MDKSVNIPRPPGTILRDDFLKPLRITRRRLAEHLGWSVKRVNRICDNEAAFTPEKALMIGAALNISPQFWMNAQAEFDLWNVSANIKLPPPLKNGKRNKYQFDKWEIGENRTFSLDSYHSIYAAASIYNKRHRTNIKLKTEIKNSHLSTTRIQ